MGYFGLKSYENDNVQDLLDRFSLDYAEEPSQEKLDSLLQSLEVKNPNLLASREKETFLGIILFLIEVHKVGLEIISTEIIIKAVRYIDDLLADRDYYLRWEDYSEGRCRQLRIEKTSLAQLLEQDLHSKT